MATCRCINLNADVLIDRLFPSLSSPGTTEVVPENWTGG